MPMTASRKRGATDYEADGGFVEDAPKSKKSKASTATSSTVTAGVQKDEDGSDYWEVWQDHRPQPAQETALTMW
jgi:hypothetical protein